MRIAGYVGLSVLLAGGAHAGDVVRVHDFLECPLELTERPLPFADWSMVEAGHIEWTGPDGEPAPLNDAHDIEKPEDVRAVPVGLAQGVELRAQPAARGPTFNETFPHEFPWERGRLQPHTLLHDPDAGLYRLWYECAGALAYAESADLVTWHKPLLNPAAYEGQLSSNIAYIANIEECRASGVFQHPESLRVAGSGTVFIDPTAEPEARYKTTVLASSDPANLQAFAGSKGKPLGARVSSGSAHCLYPVQSADGVAWTLGLEPNLLQDADTQTVVHYDARIDRYVAYTRNWDFDRRVIARSESVDFNDFPLPRTVLAPGPEEAPWTDFYNNAMTVYPGRSDLYLIFCLAYDRREDSSTIRLATSRDGSQWSFTPGPPLLSPGPADAWDAYFVMPHPGLVRRPDGSFLLYYSGYRYPHKFPRHKFQEGESGIAFWNADRLVALEAATEGEFTTVPLRLRGNRIQVNARTSRSGEIRVELLDKEFNVLNGRSAAESDALTGDFPGATLTWGGDGDLSAVRAEFVRLRFVLRDAQVFAISALD